MKQPENNRPQTPNSKRMDASTLLKKPSFESQLESILFWCAGADHAVLKNCPPSDRVKYQGIGGLILATAFLSFFTSFYAFYVLSRDKTAVLNHQIDSLAVPIALFLAIGWALMIFNLDRFIVASSGHGNGHESITWSEITQSLPRIILACLISMTLSKPVEIKLMESELDAALTTKQEQYVESRTNVMNVEAARDKENKERQRKEISEEIKSLELDLYNTEELYHAQQKSVDDEASGSSGSRKRGLGAIYDAKLATLNNLKAELDQKRMLHQQRITELKLEISTIDKRIEQIESTRKEKLDQAKTQSYKFDGLMTRVLLSHEISPWTSIILTLLFMSLEISPLLFKMTLRLGAYEHIVEQNRLLVLSDHKVIERVTIDANNNINVDAIYSQAELASEEINGPLILKKKLMEQTQQDLFKHLSKKQREQNKKAMAEMDLA